MKKEFTSLYCSSHQPVGLLYYYCNLPTSSARFLAIIPVKAVITVPNASIISTLALLIFASALGSHILTFST